MSTFIYTLRQIVLIKTLGDLISNGSNVIQIGENAHVEVNGQMTQLPSDVLILNVRKKPSTGEQIIMTPHTRPQH